MSRSPFLVAFTAIAACHSYTPAPVDLAAHARLFADRLAIVARTMAEAAPDAPFDATDGITRSEARPVAVLFHPDCRLARRRAGVALARRDEAGRWVDPRLTGDFQRILDTLPHRWLTATGLAVTIPLSGRLAAARALADSQHGATALEARLVEQRAVLALDLAWFEWSAARLRQIATAELADQIDALATIAERLRATDQIDATAARVFELERLRLAESLLTVGAAEETARLALLARMGLPPTAAVELVPSLAAPTMLPAPERRTALASGPRIALAQRRHDASERALELEIEKQWPDLNFGAGWAEEDAEPRVAFGFTLPLPLWNGNAQAIATAHARRELRAEELRIALERASHELAQGEVAHRLATSRRALLTEQLTPLAERQLQDSRTLAENGQLDPLLLLDSLRRVLTARLGWIDATVAECRTALAIQQLFWIELPNVQPARSTEEMER